MASLANQTISSSYDGLIKTSSDNAVGVSGVQLLQDGSGNDLALSLGRANNGVTITGSLNATLATAAQPNITSVGTLSSLSVSGNLAVDTNTLYVDAANNRVGVGTSSPAAGSLLDVNGDIKLAAGAKIKFNDDRYFCPENNVDGAEISANGIFKVKTGATPTERFRIDSSGNVGIGESNPDSNNAGVDKVLQITSTRPSIRIKSSYSPSGADCEIVSETDGGMVLRNYYASGNIQLVTNGSERMRIDSSGNVIVGIASATEKSISVNNSGGGFINMVAESNATSDTQINWTNTLKFISGTERMRIDSSGNVLIGDTGSGLSSAGRGVLEINGTSSSILGLKVGGTVKTYLFQNGDDVELNNTANGILALKTNAQERMRITSGGYLKASNSGTYGSSTTPIHELVQNLNGEWIVQTGHSGASNPYGVLVNFFNAAPNNTTNYFFFATDNSGTAKFYVRANGGIGNFQSNDVDLSDERTKNSIAPIDSTWDKIKGIEVVKYKYNEQTSDNFNIGVIAQQVEEVAPELVSNDGFGGLEGQENDLKSIYNKDLYFTAIKALQEAMNRIETLEAKVATLESQLNAQ